MPGSGTVSDIRLNCTARATNLRSMHFDRVLLRSD